MKRKMIKELVFSFLVSLSITVGAYDLESVSKVYLSDAGTYTVMESGGKTVIAGKEISYELGRLHGGDHHDHPIEDGYVVKAELPLTDTRWEGCFQENLSMDDWKYLTSMNEELLTEGSPLREILTEVFQKLLMQVQGIAEGDSIEINERHIEPFHKVGEKGLYVYTMAVPLHVKKNTGEDKYYSRAYLFMNKNDMDVLLFVIPSEKRRNVEYMMEDLAIGAVKEVQKENSKPLGVLMVEK